MFSHFPGFPVGVGIMHFFGSFKPDDQSIFNVLLFIYTTSCQDEPYPWGIPVSHSTPEQMLHTARYQSTTKASMEEILAYIVHVSFHFPADWSFVRKTLLGDNPDPENLLYCKA